VNSQRIGAGEGRDATDGCGSHLPLIDRIPGDLSQKGLARVAEQDRQRQPLTQPARVGDQLKVVFEALAEANAGIDDQLLAGEDSSSRATSANTSS